MQRWLNLDDKTATPPVDASALAAEQNVLVRRAVAALPVREREAIILFYLEQRPVRELCQILGSTPNAVHVRLHRGRQKLQRSLHWLSGKDGP